MRIQATPEIEVKMLLSKHLNVHYEGVKTEDEVWVKYKDNIIFNATKTEE